MNFSKSLLPHPQSGKHTSFITVMLLSFVIFAALTSGGCGSSTSSLSGGNVITNPDAVFSGAWRYSSGTVTATLNGTTHNLTVQDFAAYFTDCNVANENGTATFAAAAPLMGEHFAIPLVFDLTPVTTKRVDVDEWTANTGHAQWTITLLSDTQARLTGKVNMNSVMTADVDVTLNKVTQTSTQLDIDEVLNGTWQTAMNINDDGKGTATGGGCMIFSSGDSADILPITSTFGNMIFKDTSIADQTTTYTSSVLLATFDETGSAPNESISPVIPATTKDEELGITRIFSNVYRLKLDDNQKGVLMLSDDKKAYFIMSSAGSFEVLSTDIGMEVHAIFTLTKKTDADTVSILSQVGTTWTAATATGSLVVNGNPAGNLEIDSLSVSFPEADAENKTVTFSVSGKGTYINAYGQEQEMPLDFENTTASIERVGYNTYYAKTEAGTTFMISLFDDDTAMVSAALNQDTGAVMTITALAVKTDVDVNAVFKGAWRYASGDVSLMQNGTHANISVLDFAAFFDAVDVARDSGSARFSAVASLSSDRFLIPLVFDGEAMTTVRVSDTEWTCTTEHGSFTAKLTTPGYATLSGTVNYSLSGYSLVLNLDVTLAKVASATLPAVNIDSVLNGTWQVQGDPSTRTGSGGGFMIMNNTIYPGVGTFANIIFNDTSLANNKTTVTASGILNTVTFTGAQGPSMPLSIFDREVEISHIFSNFYRLELDDNMKGVFVVQSEESAYFILEVLDDVSGAHVHALFMLDKKTGANTVNLAGLHGTSWDAMGSGAMYNAAAGTQSVSLEDISFSFTEISDTAVNCNVTGTISFGNYVMPLDQVVSFALQNAGYNTWRGTGNRNSQMILTFFNDRVGVISLVFTAEDNSSVSLIAVLTRK